MITNAKQLRHWLFMGLIVGSSLALYNCSNTKKETDSSTATTDSAQVDSSGNSIMGRQGDTTNSSMNAPQQAPPDSADRGVVVPAEVKVKAKKE